MSVSAIQSQDEMICPECDETVAVAATWTEQYGDFVVRGCPVCECTSDVVKWINASVELTGQ